MAFKNHLARQINARTNEPLSKATAYSTLAALKAFFQWLSREGYRHRQSRQRRTHSDTRSNSTRHRAHAFWNRYRKAQPRLDRVHFVDRRARQCGCIDAAEACRSCRWEDSSGCETGPDQILQDLHDLFFFVCEDILAIFTEWVAFLQNERLWGLDDPLFPATRIAFGVSRHFEVAGLDRKCWANAMPIRTIFRAAFEGAGLPYFNPHSFRKTLALFGQEVCQTPEEFKAWSQNLGS